MSSVCYTTREEVKTSLDITETARANAQLDRLNAAATETIDGALKRTFAPLVATYTFDWPDEVMRGTMPWRLWLNNHDLIAITAMSAGGVTIPLLDVLLRPDWGPPFTRVELARDSTAGFGGGSSPQRDISITGLWGYRNDEDPAGALAAAVNTPTAGTITVSNAALIGVGHLIRVDNERMIVTDRASVDTGTTLQGALTASQANTLVPVASSAAINVGEMITLDSERMRVDDITGNNLVVRRAFDGSVLATHSNNTHVYAQRLLTVQRGAQGTTAATHTNAAPVSKWRSPALINQWARAEILVALQDEGAGYARVLGAESSRIVLGQGGIVDLRDRALSAYGRQIRHRAV